MDFIEPTETIPSGFNYSAIARTAQGNALANTNVSIRLSILKTAASGNLVYRERQSITTNQFGILNLIVGAGVPDSGIFDTINWGSDSYFLQTEMDIAGGTSYQPVNTTQLLSVPYAQYALHAQNLITGQGFSHYIGEFFGGGIIFYLWKDSAFTDHGLILSLNDLSPKEVYSNIDSAFVGAIAQNLVNGPACTQAIVSQAGHTHSAAKMCIDYNYGGFHDWYLPSEAEFILVISEYETVESILENDGNPTTKGLAPTDFYWNSTESGINSAWAGTVYFGPWINQIHKNALCVVRPMRRF